MKGVIRKPYQYWVKVSRLSVPDRADLYLTGGAATVSSTTRTEGKR